MAALPDSIRDLSSKDVTTKPKEPKDVGDYTICRTLGQGSFCKVKKAVHKHTGEAYAIKVFYNTGSRERDREIGILSRINHPNIVRFKEVLSRPETPEKAEKVYLVMELVKKGSIESRMQEVQEGKAERPSLAQIRQWFEQLIGALDYLHENGIGHFDVKPDNLLLTEDEELKLCDFGEAQELHSVAVARPSPSRGTSIFASPPEAIREMILPTAMFDVWAAGVTLYYIVTGVLPFGCREEDLCLVQFYNNIMQKPVTFPRGLDPPLCDLIRGMLAHNPTHRLSILAIQNHPWVSARVPMDLADAMETSDDDTESPRSRPSTPNPQANPSHITNPLLPSAAVPWYRRLF